MQQRAVPSNRLAPTLSELVPWTDRRGRFHPMRAAVFALLLAPGLWLLGRWVGGMLGPRAVNAAIHSTGYWAVWILLASLAVTPAKALASAPNIVVIRRMVGNAALIYACIHLALYATEQNWRLLTIASEIVKRFYLTIGFVTFLGLCALGFTSTDGWSRKLGRAWKRLHKIVYGLMVLGLIHYVLQSKLDVSQALLATGVCFWLMAWRLLPAGADRALGPLLGISLAAAVLTLLAEYAWYGLGTRINPVRVVMSEFDVALGLRPAGQVLLLGVLATTLAELRRLSLTAFGATVLFPMIVYGLGAFADDAVALFMGWPLDEMIPDGASPALMDLLWVVFFGMLGIARWRLRAGWQRRWVDGLWVGCLVYQFLLIATANRSLWATCAWLIVGAALLLGHRVWPVSRGAALMLVPLGLLLAFEAAWLL